MSVKVKFWGVRGSIPSPGPETVRFGGNTPCVTVTTPEATVILDAGSGIRIFGQKLLQEKGPTGHALTLLVSHTHWDHIQGLPFFAPGFVPGNQLIVAGPEIFNPGFEKVIADQMRHSYFPLRLGSLGASLAFRDLSAGSYDDLVPGAVVRTFLTNHPVVDLAYRIETGGKVIVYFTDHETWGEDFASFVRNSPDANTRKIEDIIYRDMSESLRTFIRGADVLIADSAYTTEEYMTRRGWGHSTHQQVYDLVKDSGIGAVYFFHHEPNRTDEELESIEADFSARNRSDNCVDEIAPAREGQEIIL